MARTREATNNQDLLRPSPPVPPAQPYVYDTLLPSQIRILVLSPGQEEDPLRGNLEILERRDDPSYKAISYAWGDPVFPQTLYLPQGQLSITESLFGALRRFRSETEPVRLWADAVCIDQNGIREKNHQVSFMHEIYEQAEEVLVWLGDAQPFDCMAVYLMQSLSELPNRWKNPNAECSAEVIAIHDRLIRCSAEQSERIQCETCGACFSISGKHAMLNAMREFVERPWFSRLWVIQEVFCAKSLTIYFGHHLVSSYTFEDANLKDSLFPRFGIERDLELRTDSGEEMFPSLPLVNIVTSVWSSNGRTALLNMIVSSRHAVHSIAHDRVFAVRRLANVQDLELLKPDYGLPISELWKRVAVVELNRPHDQAQAHFTSPMLILALAGVQRKWDTPAEPSWMPAFDELTEECVRKYEFHVEMSHAHHAGGYTDIKLSTNNNTHLLLTRSKVIGTVGTVCKGSQYRAEFHEKTPRREMMRIGIEGLLDASLGLMFQSDRQPDPAIDRCAIKVFRRWLKATQTKMSCIFDEATIESVLESVMTASYFLQHMIDRTRVLASTSTGLVGWIPEDAKPGDEISLLQGAPFPFIFRRRSDGYYSVIGDAYIQGVMQGEQWPEDNETGIEWIGIM